MRWYDVVHFLGGLLDGLIAFHNVVLSVMIFVSFILYEIDEDWHIRDRAYKDIRSFLLGLFTAAIVGVVFHA